MKISGLNKAKMRLARAEKKLETMKTLPLDTRLVEEWGEFLMALNGVFAMLEQAQKGCSKSEPWFGKVRNNRKKDELMHYLHMSRNADEHGIERVISRQLSSKFEASEDDHLMVTVLDEGVFSVRPEKGLPVKITNRAGPALKTVRDSKYGDKFQPPKLHLGKDITGISPFEAGALAVKYCRAVIADAEEKLPIRE